MMLAFVHGCENYPLIVTVTPNPALDRTLTVPEIVFDEMVRASDSRLDLDGKGVNVSKALRSLGTAAMRAGTDSAPRAEVEALYAQVQVELWEE